MRESSSAVSPFAVPGELFLLWQPHPLLSSRPGTGDAPTRQAGLLLERVLLSHPAGGGPGGNNALFHGRAGWFCCNMPGRGTAVRGLFWKWGRKSVSRGEGPSQCLDVPSTHPTWGCEQVVHPLGHSRAWG